LPITDEYAASNWQVYTKTRRQISQHACVCVCDSFDEPVKRGCASHYWTSYRVRTLLQLFLNF